MKKILIIIALFAASGTTSTQAQYRQTQTVWSSSNDGSVYRDNRGDYRWEMRDRRVWIPEYRTSGIFGIGSRRVPGHYEIRTERVKVYLLGNYYKNYAKKGHPHGMPPGQRKKLKRDYDDRGHGRDKHSKHRNYSRD